MNLPFLRASERPLLVEVALEDECSALIMQGTLARRKDGLVHLSAHLTGAVELVCDRCAHVWRAQINEPVELLLSDRLYGADEEERLPWPVVEMTDGRIDLDELILSEREAYRCDYHHCRECAGMERVFSEN